MSTTKFIAEPGKQEVTLTHVFDAPRELVFKVYTDPKHIPNWWGPKYLATTVEKMDVKQGGIWRIVQVEPQGRVHGFHGVYHSVTAPERIVSTFEYEGAPGHVVLKTITFEEHNGKTTLIDKSIFQTVEDRDGMNNAGAEKGARESMERLTELLKNKTMKNGPFVIERTYNATIQKVWSAITDKAEMKKWYFDLPEFKPEVGFEFTFTGGPADRKYVHLCKITEVVAGKKLKHSWRYEGYEGNSFVTYELFAEGDKTRLKLTHEGLETFPANNPDFARANFVEGWTAIIGTSLKEFVEK